MGNVPNAHLAIVADAKLTDYLMNLASPRGAAKAKFLLRFGFSMDRLDELRNALLSHVRDLEVTATQLSKFGTIFEVEGALECPDGRNPIVCSVWMIDVGAMSPRLITMVPRAKGMQP